MYIAIPYTENVRVESEEAVEYYSTPVFIYKGKVTMSHIKFHCMSIILYRKC